MSQAWAVPKCTNGGDDVADLTISDGLLIAATIAGPVLAVQAQKFIERSGERRRRKLHIFYTLMSTRATRASSEHVQALNVIELEFNRGWMRNRSREKSVIDAWRLHRDNLYQSFDDKDQSALKVWNERNEGSFIELMYSMSQALGFDFDRVQLKREIYYPRGQGEIEAQNQLIRRGFVRVLSGEQPIPMNVVGFPVSKEAAELQTKVQEQYLKAISGEAALHVVMKKDGK
jgi:hypothetical protein